MASTQRKEAEKFQKSYFDVLGLCCTSEVPLVERILKNLDGVKDFSVIVPSRTVIVNHDSLLISQVKIAKALNEARLEASVRVRGVKSFEKKWPSPYTIICGVLLLLSFLKFVYHPLQWLALGAVGIGVMPIVLKALTALRNLTFGDVNLLVLIAVAGSIVLKDYWEAGTIVFLFTIAEWLESRASHKATAAMSSLVNLVPQRAVLAETGEEVSVDEVKVNTLLAVKDGEIVPIDGIVTEGNCEVDEKALTGESFPVPKQKDSTVWAGTINVNGYIRIRTTAPAEDCVVARMTELVEEAQNKRSKTQRYIDKCAQYYTPAIVIISACLALVPLVFKFKNQKYWYHLALVILVSACPCALVLSTPVAMFCALTKAATSGVFFKGAQYLEILAEVRIMAFDKTGTITRAEFEVTEFQVLLDDVNLNTLLYWVSSIESKSSHPLAAALVDFAQQNSVEPKPDKVEQFQNFPGEGIYGKIDGKDIYIGNRKISTRSGCASVPHLDGNDVDGKSIGYIFLESRPAGIFCLSDVCRTGAKEALKELKSMGIKTALLTGDSSAAAKYAQKQVGGALDEVHAELLPEDKVKMIKVFQKEARTAMIGDGLNDAPALSAADIGISMGISGSALATETGNVLLMTNDIQRIPKVAYLAKRVKRKIFENMFLSIITKAAIVALAIAGHPLVWAAVLADTGTCLLVIFNSMFLLRGMTRHGRKCCKSSAVKLQHKHKDKANVPGRTHQSCCSDQKAQETFVVQTCSSKNCAPSCQPSSSSTSGGAHKHQVHKHQDSIDKLRCCAVKLQQKHEDKVNVPGHTHQSCCSDQKPQETFAVQTCSSKNCASSCQPSSSSSGGANKHQVHKHQDSIDWQSCCGQDEELHETKHSCGEHKHEVHEHQNYSDGNQLHEKEHLNAASCNLVTCDMGSQKRHYRDINCSKPKKMTVDGIVDAGAHEMEHCHHDDHNIILCKGSSSQSSSVAFPTSHKHFQVTSNPNHTNNPPTSDEEMGDVAQLCCHPHHAKTVHSDSQNHAAECGGGKHHSTINSRGNHHDKCRDMKCPNLESRQVGGCCQSFRKECCVKNSHFGANLRGGLSEIVIE